MRCLYHAATQVRALKLFAAANVLRESGGTPMLPDEQVYFNEQLKGLRRKLNSTQFDSIWSRGRSMSMKQAIEFAVEKGENFANDSSKRS